VKKIFINEKGEFQIKKKTQPRKFFLRDPENKPILEVAVNG